MARNSEYDEYDGDRFVVVKRNDGSAGVGMLLLGLAIGAGAALLFAPASGAETRDRLQREARRASRRARHVAEELGENISDGVERTRSSFDEQVDRAKEAVSSRGRAVSEAVSARGRAVGEAVTAAREAALEARADLDRAVATSKRAYADTRRAYREARADDARRQHRDDVELADSGTDLPRDTADGASSAG